MNRSGIVGGMCLLISLLVSAVSPADERAGNTGRVPFVQLAEQDGHLVFKTGLPAGRGEFSADDPTGMRLRGFVFVTNETREKRARIFRLQGRFEPVDAGLPPATERVPRAPEFSINLQTTPHPDHYVLHIKATIVIDGRTVEEEARLGRNCCGYYVSATRDGQLLPVGRCSLISELMVETAETYRQFEGLAELCCRPGFEFVPCSPFSPRVVQEVVASGAAPPGEVEVRRFDELVRQLDSDAFPRRENATQELIRGGRTTLRAISHMQQGHLSAEQRSRLRLVRNSLRELSEPVFPFRFGADRIRQLSTEPPSDWLEILGRSPDKLIRDWALSKSAPGSVLLGAERASAATDPIAQ